MAEVHELLALARRAGIAGGFFALMLATCIGAIPRVSADTDLERQRGLFLQARQALQNGDTGRFSRLADELREYPLYPYLEYDDLSRRVWKAADEEITGFLSRYEELPIAADLRRNWLGSLVRRQRWQAFVDHYTPQSDEVLQCHYLYGRMVLDRTAYLLEDIRSMWLSGESRPDQCDPVFKLLYDSDLMTPELLWQRIRLAMEKGKTGLAAYLARRLDEEGRQWVARWIAMHGDPLRWTRKPSWEDTPLAREILVYGIRRLGARDIDRGLERWEELQAAYRFDPAQLADVGRRLALTAARNHHPLALELLDAIDAAAVDEDVFQGRLAAALEHEDWSRLRTWTAAEPTHGDLRNRWLYWRARSLEQTGSGSAAEATLRLIATERDYYGFRAADRLGQEYHMNHNALPQDIGAWNEVAALPAVARARELYHLNLVYAARREWYALMNRLDRVQLQVAAALAAGWNWHDRAILTLGKAEAYDDLVLRFPLSHSELVAKYAQMRGLDASWMFALTRAESAFMVDARSPSGALGLMQVMPETGRQTAQSIGFRSYDNTYLLEPDKNITIGSAYLKQMYERFNNNIVLATAAYNAGPGAVTRWLPEDGCIDPEIWIERIPYTETRKYVSRILYFASIYDWRLQQQVMPVEKRMAMVPARRSLRAGGLSCAPQVAGGKP